MTLICFSSYLVFVVPVLILIWSSLAAAKNGDTLDGFEDNIRSVALKAVLPPAEG